MAVFLCALSIRQRLWVQHLWKSQTRWQYWICVSCWRGWGDKHIKVCTVKVHAWVNKQHVYTVWYYPKKGKHFHTVHLQIRQRNFCAVLLKISQYLKELLNNAQTKIMYYIWHCFCWKKGWKKIPAIKMTPIPYPS